MRKTTNFIYIFLTSFFLFSCSSGIDKTLDNQTLQTTKMSSSTLKIISTNPSYVPDKEKINKGKIFLTRFYTDKQIKLVTTDTIEFVDQGENFESVSCNLCGHTMAIDDWQNLMDEAHKKQFKNLFFTTPCCHKTNSLNDLSYKSSAGFAKFIITISEAEDKINSEDLRKLQDILGTTLRIVWARY